MSDCGRYLVLAIREGCDPVNRLYFADISEGEINGKIISPIYLIIEYLSLSLFKMAHMLLFLSVRSAQLHQSSG